MNVLIQKDLVYVKLYCKRIKACSKCKVWDVCDNFNGTFQNLKYRGIKTHKDAAMVALAAGMISGKYYEEEIDEV